MTDQIRAIARLVLLLASVASDLQPPIANADDGKLLAGAFAKNITPTILPVWVNGGIAGKQVDRVNDPLHARCLVLGDGRTQVAICIVDNCILPLGLVDKAKELTQAKTGISANRILIAATHTHSAVSVSGAHGTPEQQDYAEALPGWIAQGIAEAQSRMVPAQWGTTSVVCDRYIYCRDWQMKPGKANSSPFSGRTSDSVSMNPGHDNPNKIAPIGPVDTLIPILSIQDMQGKPISLLASFCTHYAGAPNLSADYFGVVCDRLAKALQPDAPESFVGLMANATSGNANCIDFSKPAVPFTHVDVGSYVADRILEALPQAVYSNQITLDSELDSIELAVRMPSSEEVTTAKRYIETHLQDRLPKTMDENYAREIVLLSQMEPTRKLNLQAIRLNDFVIVANPCESYNETGLKLRQASPFRSTMNIGLANGHAGYIPPPELFQLGGYTTWRCRTSCLEEQAEPKMVDGLVRVMHTLHSRNKKPMPLSMDTKLKSPVDPKESLRWIETESDYQVELVACEPQVVDPVSMRIDAQGRMWIVEMGDYPNKDNEPKSRIVVLQDLDRDGFFEDRKVFADKLLFATGVQPWQDGVLVTAEGQLLMLRDVDGDLKADREEVWLEGFSTGNPQLRANHPTLQPDGWLYIASGLRGGNIRSRLPFGPGLKEPVNLIGCDLRVHLLTGQIESIAGPSQFGLSFDQFDHRYGCSNRNPCFEIAAERADVSLSPLSGLASSLRDVCESSSDSHVYPLVDAWTTSNLHAGQFTAACGVLVTHSRHFPGDVYATALTCEPTGSLVQRRSIVRQNGLLTTTADVSNREWIASRDPWFRPVDLSEGPNGDIYVVDMYRAVIEHPEWVPAELKKRPDERLGDAHGRIYRVTLKSNSLQSNDLPNDRMLGEKSANISKWLAHPNHWNRSMASQAILEAKARGDSVTHVAKLREICMDPKLPIGAIANACSLLFTLTELDETTMGALLSHHNADLRSMVWNAVRQSTKEWDFKWIELAIQVLGDEVSTLNEKQSAAWFLAAQLHNKQPDFKFSLTDRLTGPAARALINDRESPHLWMAVSTACRHCLVGMLNEYRRLVRSNLRTVVMSGKAKESLTRLASRAAQEAPDDAVRNQYVASILAESQASQTLSVQNFNLAVLEGFARSGKLVIAPDCSAEKSILHFARSNAEPSMQATCIMLLASCQSKASKQLALECLNLPDVRAQKAAIASCTAHNTPEFANWLIEQFPTALPELRQDIFNAIRNDATRLALFVDKLESESLSTKLLDASQVQTLRLVRDSNIAPRIAKVLASSLNANRQTVIETYSKEMALIPVDPNNNRGKAIFAKHCAACHKLDSVGTLVGPDISDSRDQTFEKLLVSILDPNRSIDANYFRYLVRTQDGKTIEGILKDSNSQTITLQSQNGNLTTLQREEIEELKSSGTSLMPEGIEAQIPPSDMAELLWYIKNWRYAASNIPANATR